MYASRIVETATVEELFDKPQHPYTEGLFRSVPKLGAYSTRLETIPGTVPNPARFPTGCKFHTRCPRTRAAAADQAVDPRDVIETTSGGETFRVLRKSATDEQTLREVTQRRCTATQLIATIDR